MKDNMLADRIKTAQRWCYSMLSKNRHWLLLLAGIAGVSWWGGNWFLSMKISELDSSLQQQTTALLQTSQQVQELSRQKDFLQTELAVEKNTNQLLQQDIKQQQEQVFDLKKQLAVYQQIVAPTPAAGSLVIDSFRLQQSHIANMFQFSLLLIEQNKQQKQTRAQLEIWLKGKQKKRLAQIDLLKLAGFKNKDKKLLIKNFRTVEGDFTLPAGFSVSSLEIRITVDAVKAGQNRQLNKSVPWDGVSEILD